MEVVSGMVLNMRAESAQELYDLQKTLRLEPHMFYWILSVDVRLIQPRLYYSKVTF